jgi:outer membrane murein-binding lipoprotein Lpp
MPEEVAILIMVAMLGGFSLSGLSMLLKARGRRHGEVGREEVDRLSDAVETLHDQVYQLRDSMAELHERVDFAERLLTKGGKEG